ncbi:retrovirus-related pol polyprotein from transposon TNT 1-94 [Tanacetum coccineum]
MKCKKEDHKTSNHDMYIALLKSSQNYKAQPYQYASLSKQILKSKAKPYPPCTYCGFNDHHPDDCRNYPECEICGIYDHFTSRHNRVIHVIGGVLDESSQSTKSSIRVSCTTYGSNVHSTTDHNDFEHFKRETHQGAYLVPGQWMLKEYDWCQELSSQICRATRKCLHLLHMDLFGPVSPMSINHEKYTLVIVDEYPRVFNTRRQQIEETYHVTFDESMEAIRFTNTSVDEFGIDDSSRYPPDKFLQEDDPSRQYQANSNISYYIISYSRSLTQENHVPEVIAPNEQDTPHIKDVEGPPDVINTEGTQEQNVQDEQINHQPTKESSRNNSKTLVPITETLVLEVPQSQDTHHASISLYHVAQDRWSRDQHVEFVNIIGDPGEGMLTRSMAAKLIAASARWVDAMQEELNQFHRNKVWTLVPLLHGKIAIGSKWVFRNKKDKHGIVTKNKARLVAQGYNQEEGIDYDETFAPVARIEAIRIFLAFATYMNFIFFQMKQPPGFESSEFPDYVYFLYSK